MNKKIVILLLLCSGLIHGMQETNNSNAIQFYDDTDTLSLITDHLCGANGFKISAIKKQVSYLSQVNQRMCTYFDNEEAKQNIIRTIAHNSYTDDQSIAKLLNCKKIFDKIHIFHHKAFNQLFTTEELADRWYITSTICVYGSKQSLLTSAITSANIQKVKQLIDTQININRFTTEYPLLLYIGRLRRGRLGRNAGPNDPHDAFLTIAQLLFEKGAKPDARATINHSTPLTEAVCDGDKKYARLLLTFGANPETIVSHDSRDAKLYSIDTILETTSERKNAFSFDTRGWFKTMVNEVKTEKKKI
jgi:hypothetical protein